MKPDGEEDQPVLTRMMWRDVRAAPAVTVTLITLIAISVLLAGAGAGLLTAVAGAGDRLLETARSPHVVQMHTGAIDAAALEQWAAAHGDVLAHQQLELLTLEPHHLVLAGQIQTDNIQQNSLMVPATERDLLLTLAGEPLVSVEPGMIWLPVYYQLEHEIRVGDPVVILDGTGTVAELTVAGFHRDAIMNTALASSKRLAVHPDDFDHIQSATGRSEHLIEFWLNDGATAGSFTADYLASGLPSDGPTVDRDTFRILTMIGEGLVAGIVILAAVLLLVVGLVCLRLALLTALRREMREIGVLKAIGAPERSIRAMVFGRYLVIAGVAGLLGLLGAWLLVPVLSGPLTAYVGPTGTPATALAPVAVTVALVGLVAWFTWGILRRVTRISAVTALAGEAAARSGRTPRLSLHRSRWMPVGIRGGLIEAVQGWRNSALLATVFVVTCFIIVVPFSAAATIQSSDFVRYMGIPATDLRVELPGELTTAQLEDRIVDLHRSPEVAQVVAHTAVRAEATSADGTPVSLFLEVGDHHTVSLHYAEGRAPVAEDEIALSLMALAETGLSVGQELQLRIGDTVQQTRIVGAYQDITNGGRTGRATLSTEDAAGLWHVLGVVLHDGVDPAVAVDIVAAAVPEGRVGVVDTYRSQTLGPLGERIDVASGLAVGVALLLAVLITVMTTRLVMASDAGQIAIRRALGTPFASLRAHYVTRPLVALMVAVPVGVLAAATAGQSLFNLLFEGLYGGFEMLGRGTSRIEFLSTPLLTGLALPLLLTIVVAGATLAACRDVTTLNISKVVAP